MSACHRAPLGADWCPRRCSWFMGEVLMLRIFLFAILLVCLVSFAAAQTPGEEFLPAGTILHCTLDEPNFSSRTAEVGDPVLCHTRTLAARGRSAYSHSADLAGYFRDYREPGHFFGKGWMELAFDRLVLPSGLTFPLSAKVISVRHYKVDREGKIHGRGHPKRDAFEWAVPVLWPEKVITLPARGPRPALKGEAGITLRLLEDVGVPTTGVASRALPAAGAPMQLRPSGLNVTATSGLVPASSYTTGSVAGNGVIRHEQENFIHVAFDNYSLEQSTLLILKGGGGYLARDYWVESGAFHVFTPDGEHKMFPMSRLDLEETVRINRERNVTFVLRTPDANEHLVGREDHGEVDRGSE